MKLVTHRWVNVYPGLVSWGSRRGEGVIGIAIGV